MNKLKEYTENIHEIHRKLDKHVTRYGHLIDCMRRHFNETRCYEATEPDDIFDEIQNRLEVFEQMNEVMESFVNKLGFLEPYPEPKS